MGASLPTNLLGATVPGYNYTNNGTVPGLTNTNGSSIYNSTNSGSNSSQMIPNSIYVTSAT